MSVVDIEKTNKQQQRLVEWLRTGKKARGINVMSRQGNKINMLNDSKKQPKWDDKGSHELTVETQNCSKGKKNKNIRRKQPQVHKKKTTGGKHRTSPDRWRVTVAREPQTHHSKEMKNGCKKTQDINRNRDVQTGKMCDISTKGAREAITKRYKITTKRHKTSKSFYLYMNVEWINHISWQNVWLVHSSKHLLFSVSESAQLPYFSSLSRVRRCSLGFQTSAHQHSVPARLAASRQSCSTSCFVCIRDDVHTRCENIYSIVSTFYALLLPREGGSDDVRHQCGDTI